MGNRSQMRKFRKRRQRAGFALLTSVVLIVLGVVVFFRTDPFQSTSEAAPVERVSVPMISRAPEAVAEGAGQKEQASSNEQGSQDSSDNGEDQKQQQQPAEEKPVAPVPASNDLWVTIPKLGIYDAYVTNSNAESALDYGLTKRTDTGFPWQNDPNTYIVGHRLGWPGTGSDHIFYNLPLMDYGDKVYLYDDNGTTYTYEVTAFYEVVPSEIWVTKPVPGTPIVSLQTCIENYGDYWTMGPDWYVRYIVRAERVSVIPG